MENWKTIQQPTLDKLRIEAKLAALRVKYKAAEHPFDRELLKLQAKPWKTALTILEEQTKRTLQVQ